MEIKKDNLKGKTTINNGFVSKHDFEVIIQIFAEKIKVQDSEIKDLKFRMFWVEIFVSIIVSLHIVNYFF